MPKNDEYVKDNLEDEVKEDDIKENDEHYEHEQKDPQIRTLNDIKNAVWILDIYDELYILLNEYTKIDDRLRYLGISDIMYGRRSSYSIKYDEQIVCFIDVFLDKILQITKSLKKKKQYIINDDKEEFERLLSLNKDRIYSRIAFCLEKWYLD